MSTTSIRNYEFKTKPEDDFFCPVSAELLVEANQTVCCGSHLSEDVATTLERENKPCPLCNNPELRSTKDLYFRRQVGQVKIFCMKKAKGCKWEGEISQLYEHLGYGSVDAGDCKYVEVPCPYLCARHVSRHRIKYHMREECSKRPHLCNYCNFEGSHGSIINDHLPVCEKFPTKCTNCDELMCRADIKKHIDTVCPLQVVKCDFDYAGCTGNNLHRKDIKKHMEHNTQYHLDLLAKHSKKKEKEIEGLKCQVQLLTNVVAKHLKKSVEMVGSKCSDIGFIKPAIMTLTNFQELHMKKEYWKSPEFYSHIGGYKMCLVVFPGSETDHHGNEFMGVYMQMLEGEYDSQLKWPFYGKVEIRMLNQDNDKDHIERALLDAASYKKENFRLKMVDRVQGSGTPSVWGCGNFIALKNLRYNRTAHTQFLKDDCVKFQIVNISLLESSSI